MKEMSLEEMKHVRMDILSAIDSFCCNNGIHYSIACGTLLGAVRHGGFIPWDDDIDIYMLRSDFENFERIFPSLYMKRYRLLTINNTPNWHLPFGKVEDIRTKLVNPYVNIVSHGVDIDIFIVDEVPDNESEWIAFRKKQKKLIQRNLLQFCKLSKAKGIPNKIMVLYSKLFCGFNREKTIKRISSYICQFNGKGYHKCFETSQGVSVKKPFNKELFVNLIDWKFEDRFYKGFKDADSYLTDTYGDYMQLPPVDKRINHHLDTAYWL